MSSDTNSSANTLDQSTRIRIGGLIPFGSNHTQVGVPMNHFYQTQSISRDGKNVSHFSTNNFSMQNS